MRKLLFLSIILYALTTSAQLDKENFEKIFEEETNNSKYSKRESHSGTYQYTLPQLVPRWFITPPVSNDSLIYSIGISDPEMDTVNALEMAVYRARVMANVLYKGTTQLLCDFFLNEVNNSSDIAYEHFSRINAKIPFNDKFEIVETYRNSFDETMVLIKYYPPKNIEPNQFNRIKLEHYKSEIESSSYGNFESVYEFWVQANSDTIADPVFYQITKLGPRHDVMSAQGNIQKQVPIYSLQYKGIPSADSTELCNFSHGLWKEYFKSTMVFIMSKAREKPENIKQITDSYQKNTFEKLTRGISMNKMRFVLTNISATNNKLKVTLQELPYK